MMLRTSLVLALATGVAAQERAGDFFSPRPTLANRAAWLEHIQPGPEELRWESIPWRQGFGEGLLEADTQGRPLLLWAMNGHPLGCT